MFNIYFRVFGERFFSFSFFFVGIYNLGGLFPSGNSNLFTHGKSFIRSINKMQKKTKILRNIQKRFPEKYLLLLKKKYPNTFKSLTIHNTIISFLQDVNSTSNAFFLFFVMQNYLFTNYFEIDYTQ